MTHKTAPGGAQRPSKSLQVLQMGPNRDPVGIQFGSKNAKKVAALLGPCTSGSFNICNTSHAKLTFLHVRQARIFFISAMHLKKASKKLTILSTMFWRVPGRLRSASMALLRYLTDALGAPSGPFLQYIPCNIAISHSLKKTPKTAPGGP